MLIVVDPQSGVPVYRQLMDQIKFHIASGLVSSGDELPSTRVLSSDLGLNPMTVSKAYSFLEKEGVVERRPGRPLVVSALGTAELEDRKKEQLTDSLARAALLAKQLGVDPEEALRIFSKLLRDERPARNQGHPRQRHPKEREP